MVWAVNPVTFEDGIRSFLTGSPYPLAVQGRVYSHAAPQGPTQPYIVMYRIAVTPRHVHRGAPDLLERLMQFSIFGTSQSQVLGIADALRRLLAGYSGTMGSYTVAGVFWSGERSGFNEATRMHQIAADFRIQYFE